jgi:BlaI family transcriptional regulator, penicillinase repressor
MARFTAGELKVMQLLWQHGELKPSDLQRLFPEPIKNPALRSYLTILVNKGHVTRRKVGKAFFYQAKTAPHRAFLAMLGDLVETFCAGSVENLVMALVRKEKLSAEDLIELKRLADDSGKAPSLPLPHDTPRHEPREKKR